jgi:V/A-type H+-transporting ATPase subunit I
VDEATRRAAAARDREIRAGEALESSRRLRRAGLDVGRLRDLRFAAVRVGLARTADLGTLAALLAPAPFAVIPLEADEAVTLAAVAVPAGGRERAESALRMVSFQTIGLPESAAEADEAVLARRGEEAKAEQKSVRSELERTRQHAGAELADLARRADASVLLLQAQTCFAAAGRFVVISGWVPAEAAARMKTALAAASGGRAVVDVERPEDLPEAALGGAAVPILHRNPLLLRPFERLVSLYGTPAYREVEPTAFFALSFLLMFGLMFGDVGHGLVLFAAGWCLFRYVPRYLDYGIMLMEGGVSSAVFGGLYGSVFGMNLLPAVWMEPLADLPRFMWIAAGLGAFLVSAGLVLNVVNTWRSGEPAAALFGSRGLFGAFLYWVLLALVVRAFLPVDFALPGWVLMTLVASAALLLVLRPVIVPRLERRRPPRPAHAVPIWLVLLDGSVEIVDAVFSFFANTISFVRVAAFAAVHAGIFIALFSVADTLARLRFGGETLSLVSIVAGNILIVLLEGLTVSVQVLRLEYYEFFSKFFRGGGEPYRPLMLRVRAGKDDHDSDRTRTPPAAGGDGAGAGAAAADPGARPRAGAGGIAAL